MMDSFVKQDAILCFWSFCIDNINNNSRHQMVEWWSKFITLNDYERIIMLESTDWIAIESIIRNTKYKVLGQFPNDIDLGQVSQY